jgi:hypothetical protein
MLAIPVGCPLLSDNGQNVALPRLSALCQKQTRMGVDHMPAHILFKMASTNVKQKSIRAECEHH